MSKVPWQQRYEPVRSMFEARGIEQPERVMKFCLLSPPRIAGVIRACDSVSGVSGATAEIGCASGGTTRLISLLTKRRHWACDTFEGLVDAGKADPELSNGDFSNRDSTLAGVTERAADLQNVTVVQGRFPDSATPEMRDSTYALVHLDTDTYQSMKDGFAFFEWRMQSGSIMILDDVVGRGTTGAKRFWSEVGRDPWQIVEENDRHVVIRKR